MRLTACTPRTNFDFAKAGDTDTKSTVQHYVFSWLNWSPEPESACYIALHKHFPGAIPGTAVHYRTKCVLESKKYGFTPENTLFGTSICPDEINNLLGELTDIMKNHWGEIFPLGGISGAPFVGATGFSAFSHHVAEDGNIMILFGPHVAISADGEVGKYLRDGQHQLSCACGAVIGAYNACGKRRTRHDSTGSLGGGGFFDETDMQMAWIKTQLKPHMKSIQEQPNPMAALAFQAYEMVKAALERIAATDFGRGKLVLIGGIQINLPKPFQDHFLPLMFDVREEGQPAENLLSTFSCALTQQEMNAMATPESSMEVGQIRRSLSSHSGEQDLNSALSSHSVNSKRLTMFKEWEDVKEAVFDHSDQASEDAKATKQHMVFAWMTFSPQPKTPCYTTLHKHFPGALPGPGVHCRVKAILTADFDFTPDNTLFGNSICPDEINNMKDSLSMLMSDYWEKVFPMGGIGGAPFVGKTGFKAFSSHVPVDGNIVILYGPHVAISDKGEVGKHLREGQQHASTACGAVIGAYHACNGMTGDEDEEFDEADMQMGWIKSQIMPHCARIARQKNPMAALSYQAFESVKAKMDKVVSTNFGSGRLVLVGGIQINMPPPCSDHFLPMVFEVRQAGKPVEDLLEAFKCPITQDALQHHHEQYHFHHDP